MKLLAALVIPIALSKTAAARTPRSPGVKDVAQTASELRQEEEPAAALEAMKTGKTGERPRYFKAKRAGNLIRNLGLGFEPKPGAQGYYAFEVTRDQLYRLSQVTKPMWPAFALGSPRIDRPRPRVANSQRAS
jgi:hypothetical protein